MLPEYLSQVKKLVKDKMLKSISNSNKIEEAMAYSALADSKMIRAGLVFASSETNKNISKESIITLSSAVELMHTYSLIHDDLPCMDDDNLRHGLSTIHNKWNNSIAILAGDAIQPMAYYSLTHAKEIEDQLKVKLVSMLTMACGQKGMVEGSVSSGSQTAAQFLVSSGFAQFVPKGQHDRMRDTSADVVQFPRLRALLLYYISSFPQNL